jgi:hypothetical protein
MGKLLLLIFILLFLLGCNDKKAGLSWLNEAGSDSSYAYVMTFSKVSHLHDGRIKLEGTKLQGLIDAKIKTGDVTLPLHIDSQTPTTVYLKAKAMMSLAVGTAYELLLSTAYAQQSLPITLSIPYSSLTNAHLNSLSSTAANQVLVSDGMGNVVWTDASSFFTQDICPDVTYMGTTYSFSMVGADPRQAGTYCISSEIVTLPFNNAVEFCKQLHGDICSPTELAMSAKAPTSAVWTNAISHDGTSMIVTTFDDPSTYSSEDLATGNLPFFCCRR